MLRSPRRPDPRQARPRRLSTAGALRRRKRGLALDPQGFDAGKKVTGRKRYNRVGVLGLLPGLTVLRAIVKDRDSFCDLSRKVRRRVPFLERVTIPSSTMPPS